MTIRLKGLAAPQGDEPGGTAATKAMLGLVQGATCSANWTASARTSAVCAICYLEGAHVGEGWNGSPRAGARLREVQRGALLGPRKGKRPTKARRSA